MSGSAMPMPPADPDAGAAPPAPDDVVVTIVKTGDGSYTVYAGDEPDEGAGGDMAGGDAMAAGGAPPPPPAPQGTPADSIGAALKAAMDILQSDASGGDQPGNAQDQFASGFGAAPPSGGQLAQKY